MRLALRAHDNKELVLRRALLLLAGIGALTAVFAGLARLGTPLGWGPSYANVHGPLFVLGVFGTVIALERAVALARTWALLAPTAGASTALALLLGIDVAPWIAVACCVALVAVNVAIVRRQATAPTWLMLLGSALFGVGTVGWALGHPVFEVVPTWLGFFVLTIVAERLELSRLLPTPRWAQQVLVLLAAALGVSCCAALSGSTVAARAFGVAAAGLGAWLLRFDIARRTARQRGLPRYAALGVMVGAVWLLVCGVLFASFAVPVAGPLYDAALHTVLVGYVLSMVLAHAPIILPAVAHQRLDYHPLLYVPMVTLHLGLCARVLGDLLANVTLREAGGTTNALALASIPVAIAAGHWLGSSKRHRSA